MSVWNRNRARGKRAAVPKLVWAPGSEEELLAYKRLFRGVCGAQSSTSLRRGMAVLQRQKKAGAS